MGYVGLLLNAPYKIDSMVWMRLWIMFGYCYSFDCYLVIVWLYKPGVFWDRKVQNMGIQGFGGCRIKTLALDI
jgi:hypothetical protein